MATAELLDFVQLLTPLSTANPAGEDLRSDPSPVSPYHVVKDARAASRATERQLLVDPEAAISPDWRPVQKNSIKVLAEKSKDLEIAAYLIEALVRLHGFAGLRDGFRLAREIVDNFWDDFYPLPDEDGLEARLAPLAGLNGTEGEGILIGPILRVPLTEGANVGPFACYHCQQALALSQIVDEKLRAKRIQEGALALDKIQQAVAESSRSFFTQLLEDLTQCQDEFARLTQMLEAKCGDQAPPSSNIRDALSACREVLFQVAQSKLPSPTEPAPDAAGTTPDDGHPAAAATATAAAGPGGSNALRTREDAFAMLLKVAEFFRQQEPHSVVSYGLEQVVRWGKMSLPDLLTELIPDDSPRGDLFKQVGIRVE
jgi:type VI secretion system protein ImpA